VITVSEIIDATESTCYKLLWYIIVVSPAATGQVKLSSNETQACPGETVKFTCMVYNGAQLQWTIPFDRAITFLPVHSPGRVVNRTGVVANLTSVQRHPLNNLAANMTSTLTYRAWNNTEVFCGEELISVNVSSKWCVCTVLLLVVYTYILIPTHPHPCTHPSPHIHTPPNTHPPTQKLPRINTHSNNHTPTEPQRTTSTPPEQVHRLSTTAT